MDRFPTNPRTIDEVGAALRKLELALRKALPTDGAGLNALFDDGQFKSPTSAEVAGINGAKTFYAASSSGGTANVLNTLTFSNGRVIQWTQVAPGGLTTASKRGSMIHTFGSFVWYMPVPDGTLAAADRKHLAGLYSGV